MFNHRINTYQMEKFNNKYRIASARLKGWDYGSNAAYFVTICTHGRVYYFGRVVEGKMRLSGIGELAQQFWGAIPDHFSFVRLGEFVIMPDHMHGIIIIDGGDVTGTPVETPDSGVSTAAASRKWKPGTLGVMVNQYKRMVTIHARKINADFAWQSRFHDHVIRNDGAFQRISNYIINNPVKW